MADVEKGDEDRMSERGNAPFFLTMSSSGPMSPFLQFIKGALLLLCSVNADDIWRPCIM